MGDVATSCRSRPHCHDPYKCANAANGLFIDDNRCSTRLDVQYFLGAAPSRSVMIRNIRSAFPSRAGRVFLRLVMEIALTVSINVVAIIHVPVIVLLPHISYTSFPLKLLSFSTCSLERNSPLSVPKIRLGRCWLSLSRNVVHLLFRILANIAQPLEMKGSCCC